MLAPNNIFSPLQRQADHDADAGHHAGLLLPDAGLPSALPKDREKVEHLPLFANSSEVEFAIASRKVDYRQWIRSATPTTQGYRLRHNPDYRQGSQGLTPLKPRCEGKIIETTVGRVVSTRSGRPSVGFINNTVGKKQLGDIIWHCYQVAGQAETVKVARPAQGPRLQARRPAPASPSGSST